jgi:2-oxo-4-hydroxy-4-carboxy--5-ureidoimidazoline (OHCU) decarboxylase
MQEKLALLQEEMARPQAAADYLAYSMTRCQDLIGRHELSMEEMERLESLTSRFARLADLLIQRIFRLIDDIELTGASTVLDRIYRTEKRGFGAASDIIKICELRNIIAYE